MRIGKIISSATVLACTSALDISRRGGRKYSTDDEPIDNTSTATIVTCTIPNSFDRSHELTPLEFAELADLIVGQNHPLQTPDKVLVTHLQYCSKYALEYPEFCHQQVRHAVEARNYYVESYLWKEPYGVEFFFGE